MDPICFKPLRFHWNSFLNFFNPSTLFAFLVLLMIDIFQLRFSVFRIAEFVWKNWKLFIFGLQWSLDGTALAASFLQHLKSLKLIISVEWKTVIHDVQLIAKHLSPHEMKLHKIMRKIVRNTSCKICKNLIPILDSPVQWKINENEIIFTFNLRFSKMLSNYRQCVNLPN